LEEMLLCLLMAIKQHFCFLFKKRQSHESGFARTVVGFDSVLRRQ
jgi:hypothetical protein